jgi:DNA-binding response OmpR family regulator
MSREKILVVDDDPEIRELISKYLKKEEFNVTETSDGYKALQLLKNTTFDLIILDIMMEGIDGFEVLRRIRSDNDNIHVIMLSAREEDHDKVLGLGLGADDYITKPFSPQELIARIKSHLRRNNISITNKINQAIIIEAGIFKIDTSSYNVTKSDKLLELSAKEMNLLKFFMENTNRVFTKKQIYENVWKDNYFDENSLSVYIRHLREKIEDNPNEPTHIITVWGIGYKFNALGKQ